MSRCDRLVAAVELVLDAEFGDDVPAIRRVLAEGLGAPGELWRRSNLMIAVGRSKGALSVVGDPDWTPHDSIHQALVDEIEAFVG